MQERKNECSGIFSNKKFKELLIISGISIFIIYGFYFISILGVNVPYLDDWSFVPFVKIFLEGGVFWEYPNFIQHNEHRPIFPGLVILGSVLLTSWNFISLMYFGGILIVISIIVCYFLLQKTFPKILWIIIPISALMFNPAQYENLIWAFTANAWFLVFTGIFLSIFFLNKVQQKDKYIVFAIILGIIASFSEIAGLLIWPVGFLSILTLKNKKKKMLAIWSCATIMVLILYFTNFQTSSNIDEMKSLEFLSLDGLKYYLFYLSNGFIMKFDVLRLIAGGIILFSILVGPIILKYQKIEMVKIIPWLQIGLVGLLGAGMSVVARLTTTGYIPSRYIIIAIFAHVAATVLITMILKNIYNNHKHNKNKKIILNLFFILILFGSIIALSSSHYIGWVKGDEWYQERIMGLDCLSNSQFEFKCPNLYTYQSPITPFTNAKILTELELGPFKNNKIEYSEDILLEQQNWSKMKNELEGFSKIESFLLPVLDNKEKNVVDKELKLMPIKGWGILKNGDEGIDSVYIVVDNKVHSKAVYGLLNKDIPTEISGSDRSFSGWSGVIDIDDLVGECHDISIRFVKENQYFETNSSIKLCFK
jgi:hypothetical protein